MPVCKTQPLPTTSLLNQCWTVRPYAPRSSKVEIDESNELNTAELCKATIILILRG